VSITFLPSAENQNPLSLLNKIILRNNRNIGRLCCASIHIGQKGHIVPQYLAWVTLSHNILNGSVIIAVTYINLSFVQHFVQSILKKSLNLLPPERRSDVMFSHWNDRYRYRLGLRLRFRRGRLFKPALGLPAS